jgi:hypothetical protein
MGQKHSLLSLVIVPDDSSRGVAGTIYPVNTECLVPAISFCC